MDRKSAANAAKLLELLSRRQTWECDEARRIAANIDELKRNQSTGT
jgi:hypothetical protein